MRPNPSKDQDFAQLRHAKEHNISGVSLLEEKRRKEEAEAKRQNAKKQRMTNDDDFVDDEEPAELDPKIAKQLQKIKHSTEEDYQVDRPVDIAGPLLQSIARTKPAAPKPKKIDEKVAIESENLMLGLFDELDKKPSAPPRAAPRSSQIQPETTHSMEPTSSKMDEELPKPHSFEDELEELEAQMGQLDVEKPAEVAPKRQPASSNGYRSTPTSSGISLHMSDRDIQSLEQSLYIKKRAKYIEKHRSLQGDNQTNSGRPPVKVTNGKLHFYWMDIQEEFRKKSLLHLYGKVRLENGQCASACLTVENLQRTYYIVKRVNENINLDQVADEVSQKIQKRHPAIFKEVKIKKVTDKYYAFELDIARGKIEAIEVTYSFDHAPLEIPFEGDTYKGIIGKTYKTTELFVILNDLMGPCWLEVENFTRVENKEFSTCDYEFKVRSSYDVEAPNHKEAGDPPKCKMMSINLVKDKEGGNEIRAITAYYNDNYDIENVQNDLRLVPMVFIQVKKENIATYKNLLKRCFGENVHCLPSEFALMNAFGAVFNALDPDIVIGHDINNMFFEPFIARAERGNLLPVLSKLSKSYRNESEMKRAIKTFGLKKIRAVSYGRMVCDTLLCCQEHIRETNYELDFLAEKHLGEPNLCEYRAASSDELRMTMQLIDENLMNAYLSLSLSQKLQLVQLTKQLTNVSGCFWYQSFQNMRAERNEMLLMHTFHKSHFIFPDKYQTKWDDSKKGKKREKAKYEGGLVLEPKSNLYQDFILLLDFNSLYPSIIREYKICFTTVNRDYVEIDFYEPSNTNKGGPTLNDDDDDDAEGEDALAKIAETTRIPDHDFQNVPEEKWNQILPKIVQRLIEKRKEVKGLIKSAKSSLEKDTLDIKQKAYKLIANSIYGCLGFKNSRFYSRQMAALITYYGRNTLQKTAQKVAELQYDVIYGDTDSLMINSKQKDLLKAIEEGLKIKKIINKNSKLLEIDVDGIFRSLLLLKKKKYAADKLQNLDEVKKSMKAQDAKFAIELKGLDIVRRDWSGLTKLCGDYLVQQILNIQTEVDDINMNIYNYFISIMADLKAGKLGLDLFIIYKQLTKNLSEYNDKGQPHVVVAKRMKNTMNYTNEQLVNHFIPYIICEAKGNLVGSSFAERAYHPDEVRAQGLKPDIKWYTNNQLLNPVMRLVEHLQGFNQENLEKILEIEHGRMSRALESKADGAFVHAEGTSVLYHAEETGGTFIDWKCPDGHKNQFKIGDKNLLCEYNLPSGVKCSKHIAMGSWKNLSVQATRAQMMDYNNSVFALQKKSSEEASSKLPIYQIECDKDQEQALADAVIRVNTKLNNLEKLFDSKHISEPELKQCMDKCKKGIDNLKHESQYSRVNFGGMCSKVSKDRSSCRHYQYIVSTPRPKLKVL